MNATDIGFTGDTVATKGISKERVKDLEVIVSLLT